MKAFDPSPLKSLHEAGVSIEQLDKMYQLFCCSMDVDLGQLDLFADKALDQDLLEGDIKNIVHRMRSGCAMIGAKALYTQFSEMESGSSCEFLRSQVLILRSVYEETKMDILNLFDLMRSESTPV